MYIYIYIYTYTYIRASVRIPYDSGSFVLVRQIRQVLSSWFYSKLLLSRLNSKSQTYFLAFRSLVIHAQGTFRAAHLRKPEDALHQVGPTTSCKAKQSKAKQSKAKQSKTSDTVFTDPLVHVRVFTILSTTCVSKTHTITSNCVFEACR